MEQYNDAVQKLEDPELRKKFEREAEEEKCRDDSYVDDGQARRSLQKHFREIQKSHQK